MTTYCCISCGEPLDYPAGDGCAAMLDHRPDEYRKTRDSASKVRKQYSKTLERLEDEMSLQSKAQQYDVLVAALFGLLTKGEESEEGTFQKDITLTCSKEDSRQKLEEVLKQLKSTLEDWG